MDLKYSADTASGKVDASSLIVDTNSVEPASEGSSFKLDA